MFLISPVFLVLLKHLQQKMQPIKFTIKIPVKCARENYSQNLIIIKKEINCIQCQHFSKGYLSILKMIMNKQYIMDRNVVEQIYIYLYHMYTFVSRFFPFRFVQDILQFYSSEVLLRVNGNFFLFHWLNAYPICLISYQYK